MYSSLPVKWKSNSSTSETLVNKLQKLIQLSTASVISHTFQNAICSFSMLF